MSGHSLSTLFDKQPSSPTYRSRGLLARYC